MPGRILRDGILTSERVDTLTVPGNHASCISEHAATLADRLNEALPSLRG